jgi:hypothetical protein
MMLSFRCHQQSRSSKMKMESNIILWGLLFALLTGKTFISNKYLLSSVFFATKNLFKLRLSRLFSSHLLRGAHCKLSIRWKWFLHFLSSPIHQRQTWKIQNAFDRRKAFVSTSTCLSSFHQNGNCGLPVVLIFVLCRMYLNRIFFENIL